MRKRVNNKYHYWVDYFDNMLRTKYLGGYYDDEDHETYHDDIMEFDPLIGQWELVDRMLQSRTWHAVSIINFEPELCV